MGSFTTLIQRLAGLFVVLCLGSMSIVHSAPNRPMMGERTCSVCIP